MTIKDIEEYTACDGITDLELIDKVMGNLMEVSYIDLIGENKRFKAVAKDLCKGFDLDLKYVEMLRLRDMLVLIGYEPGVEWFNPPEGGGIQMDEADRKFNTANSCFELAYYLNCNNNENEAVHSFLNINLQSFVSYLKSMLPGKYLLLGKSNEEMKQMSQQISDYYEFMIKFICEFQSEDYGTDDLRIADVLYVISRAGTSAWNCGVHPLNRYVEKIYTAYVIAKILLMDCIRTAYIDSDRDAFHTILAACSNLAIFRLEDCKVTDFKDCYED